MKKCTKCKTEKGDCKFRARGKGLNSWCRECESENNKLRYTPKKRKPAVIKSEEEIKIAAKRRMLKHRYNITLEEYVEMYDKQNEKCAICKEDYELGGRKGLYVDHDHKTGKVRGLLCPTCNPAIGKFRDSKTILENAIKYLEK